MKITDIFKGRGKETRSFFPMEANYFSSGLFKAELCPPVDTAVSKIANTISILPMNLYVHTATGSRLAYWTDESKILKDPAVEETPALFYKTLVRHMLLKGNAYVYKIRDNSGKVVCLQLVDPNAITLVDRDPSGRKTFLITGVGGYLTDRDIIHFIMPAEGYNGLKGLSPADVHKDLIELYNILSEYIAIYFNQGIGSKLVFEMGDKFEPGKQNLQKLVQELSEYYRKFWGGKNNSGMPGLVPPGLIAKTLDMGSNVQGQYQETLLWVESMIYKIFDIPPEILIPSENKYGSLSQKQQDYLSSCIQPLCIHIAQTFEKGLLEDNATKALFISFDFNALIETDIAEKQDRLIKGFQSGLYTLNEIREQLHLPAIENETEGSTRVIGSNLMPYTEENIKAILASSKLKLKEYEAGRADVDVKTEAGHNPVGRDMLK